MPSEIFSNAWASDCARELNHREFYRVAAAAWEGAVVLVCETAGAGQNRRVWLDLWHGECREARAGSAADLEMARYVFSARASIWRQLLGGKMAPLPAVMTGCLRLTKGAIADLIPYASAAQELVAAAAAVATVFPDGEREGPERQEGKGER